MENMMIEPHPNHAIFLPHQLYLVKDMAKNLISGKGVMIKHEDMQKAKQGHHILLLKKQNARKLMTAFNKNKGIHLKLTPDEIHHTIHHGKGFFDIAKNIYHSVSNTIHSALKNPIVNKLAQESVKYGGDALGELAVAYTGNPSARLITKALTTSAEHAIKNNSLEEGSKHLVGTAKKEASKIAYDAVKEKIDEKIPEKLRPAFQEALKQTFDNHNEEKMLGYGIRMHKKPHMIKGSKEAKEHMANLRKMRMMKKGGDIGDDFRNAFDPQRNGLSQAFSNDNMKQVAKYIIPSTTSAIGGVAGEFLGGPIGGLAGSSLGSYAGQQLNKQIGLGIRKRGRPPKQIGGSLTSSKLFRDTLKNSYGLNTDLGVIQNEPVKHYNPDPRIKMSNTEMTLSQYGGINSPGMHPFIPTSYIQQGGTSQRFIADEDGGVEKVGRGLYGAGLF